MNRKEIKKIDLIPNRICCGDILSGWLEREENAGVIGEKEGGPPHVPSDHHLEPQGPRRLFPGSFRRTLWRACTTVSLWSTTSFDDWFKEFKSLTYTAGSDFNCF